MKKKFLMFFLVGATLFNNTSMMVYGLEEEVNKEIKTVEAIETNKEVEEKEIKENIEIDVEIKEEVKEETKEEVKENNEKQQQLEKQGEQEKEENKIDEKQEKEELVLKESDFKYVKKDEVVGKLKDKKYAIHKITNRGIIEEPYNSNYMGIKNDFFQSSSFSTEPYIIQEIFLPDGNGNVRYFDRRIHEFIHGGIGSFMFWKIPKDLYKDSKYVYVRVGVAETEKFNSFTDVIAYKIDNPFYDGYLDIEGHYAEKIIMEFSEKGYINGYSDKTFRPNNAITRAEFIKITNKYFGYKNNRGVENFTDVDKSHWFYNEVNIALNAGYITSSNSKFRPNDPISREEVASIVTTIKNKKDGNLDKIKKLADYNKISSWARTSVEGSIEAGYMGKGGTSFRPKDNITRAEAVTTLSRIE